MQIGDIELLYLGNKSVAAVWQGRHLQPDTLLECSSGTLTAAEYVAIKAMQDGVSDCAAVRLFCARWLGDPGEIESAEAVLIH